MKGSVSAEVPTTPASDEFRACREASGSRSLAPGGARAGRLGLHRRPVRRLPYQRPGRQNSFIAAVSASGYAGARRRRHLADRLARRPPQIDIRTLPVDGDADRDPALPGHRHAPAGSAAVNLATRDLTAESRLRETELLSRPDRG
jgi:hypothetical protein